MSSCCCGCGTLTCPDALGRRRHAHQQLLEGEANRADMDLDSLRAQYRRTQEKQKRHMQVVLFRRVSAELSESLSVVPIMQGLSPPQEENSDLPASGLPTFDTALTTCDPWHTHLGLYRRAHLLTTGVAVTPSHPPTTDAYSNEQWMYSPRRPQSRCSSSLLEAAEQEVLSASTADTAQKPSAEVSPSSSPNRTRGDNPVLSFNRSKGEPATGNHCGPGELSGDGAKEDGVADSVSGSKDASVAGSLTSSDESSTPVGSVGGSAADLSQEVERNKSVTGGDDDQRDAGPAAPRKFSVPAPTLTKQLSFWGAHTLTAGPGQNHHYYPFPQRKTPRKSEAARKLGMYASL